MTGLLLPALLLFCLRPWSACSRSGYTLLFTSGCDFAALFLSASRADARPPPSPADSEPVGLVARILISSWSAYKSLVLAATLAIPRPGWPRVLQCAVRMEISPSRASKNRHTW